MLPLGLFLRYEDYLTDAERLGWRPQAVSHCRWAIWHATCFLRYWGHAARYTPFDWRPIPNVIRFRDSDWFEHHPDCRGRLQGRAKDPGENTAAQEHLGVLAGDKDTDVCKTRPLLDPNPACNLRVVRVFPGPRGFRRIIRFCIKLNFSPFRA